MFALQKAADVNKLVKGGQLKLAFPFTKCSLGLHHKTYYGHNLRFL
jgi:hypothetical protein